MQKALLGAVLVTAGALFALSVSAADPDHYEGWPCYTNEECTIHRANPFTLPTENTGFILRVHDQNGDYEQSPCSGYDPDDLGTFTFTFTNATSGIVVEDLIRYPDNFCVSGGQLWESATGTVSILSSEGGSTSTINATFSPWMVSSTWDNTTSTGNGSSTSAFGAKTADKLLGGDTEHFPGCMIYPVATLVDTLNAATNGTADAQTLTLHFRNNTNWTIDFSEMGNVTAVPGIASFTQTFGNLVLAILWLLLTLFVVHEIYTTKSAAHE